MESKDTGGEWWRWFRNISNIRKEDIKQKLQRQCRTITEKYSQTDGRTDGQTDRQTDSETHITIARATKQQSPHKHIRCSAAVPFYSKHAFLLANPKINIKTAERRMKKDSKRDTRCIMQSTKESKGKEKQKHQQSSMTSLPSVGRMHGGYNAAC